MTDALDKLIREIQETSVLSSEARNTLHGALSKHPWGKRKTFDERKAEVLFVTAGRDVPAISRYNVERLQA